LIYTLNTDNRYIGMVNVKSHKMYFFTFKPTTAHYGTRECE